MLLEVVKGWRILSWQPLEYSVSGERKKQALLPAIRVSGGGKELVLLPAVTVDGGRLEEALPETLGVGGGD